ncbi:hypothetical protein BDV19DRAFT_361684 [Aspergillus venezuelensis]
MNQYAMLRGRNDNNPILSGPDANQSNRSAGDSHPHNLNLSRMFHVCEAGVGVVIEQREVVLCPSVTINSYVPQPSNLPGRGVSITGLTQLAPFSRCLSSILLTGGLILQVIMQCSRMTPSQLMDQELDSAPPSTAREESRGFSLVESTLESSSSSPQDSASESGPLSSSHARQVYYMQGWRQ